jgi:hypothetical protein
MHYGRDSVSDPVTLQQFSKFLLNLGTCNARSHSGGRRKNMKDIRKK